MVVADKIAHLISSSNYISRDLSWLQFNFRVLDQSKAERRNVFERLKFLAITSSNLDEFFMIRVGSLYNYIDYGKERVDYSGLRETPFRKKLLAEAHRFTQAQCQHFVEVLRPMFRENGFVIKSPQQLRKNEKERVNAYFTKTIYPMLTPMVFDNYHTFPILMNKILVFGVTTRNPEDKKDNKKLSFIQIPQNLPRFYEIEREDDIVFVPIEEIIRENIDKLFRNVEILSTNLLRVTRNGDFTLEESDDIEANFVEELKIKLKTRKTGRVVRIEVQEDCDRWIMKTLKGRWELDDDNIFRIPADSLMDFTGLWQIINNREFKDRLPAPPRAVPPLTYPELGEESIFEVLKNKDIMLHSPYNSIEPVLELIEQAAEDPNVLAIKMTIYRLAKESRITNALLKAAENGKHVSVLFEVKARFDEENNIREAQKLQKAGCFVIYGISSFKTHTKLLLIVRKEGEKVRRYVHLSSGNYNEDTARMYTDVGILTTDETYANDISEFFNVITGHSRPSEYTHLITAPKDMRQQLLRLIEVETQNAKAGLPAGIVIKMNSLEDQAIIDAFYAASQAGVIIKLVVRGICCLRPGRPGLSDNITVSSIVGDFLEHSRLFYFHNNGNPKVYGGSADLMVRSFERRLESLFAIVDETLKQQAINILFCNLRDNINAYEMREDGSYVKKENTETSVNGFSIHEQFYKLKLEDIYKAKLF
ncbi:polyphosphate kinase 1 [Cytophagales bacterium LB-30]|uniref:Polyphosphate kinase n=1 Tax=Shiella aurantiaca TaxID=3058365 RepID=A0ABT8F415_9BACT|nr:polyphosphate kinase 1 [Shiella aurantiaca]MDN4165195.1 polyphosphate kinase 1 [Shiella aurantiaca]